MYELHVKHTYEIFLWLLSQIIINDDIYEFLHLTSIKIESSWDKD